MRNITTDLVLQPFPQIANSLTTATEYSNTLPPGWDYRDFSFALEGGLTTAMIEELRFLVNGEIIQRYDGQDLDLMNQFFKLPAYNALGTSLLAVSQRRLGIRGGVQSFTPPANLLSGSAKDLAIESSLNCGSFDAQGRGIGSLEVQVVVNNTPAGGTLMIRPYAEACDPYPGGPGLMKIVDKTVFNAVASTNTVTKNNGLKYGDLRHLMLDQLILIPAAGNLTNFVVKYNNNDIRKRTADRNSFIQTLDNLRTPQNGVYVIDFTEHGWGDEALNIGPSATTLELMFDSDTAGGVSIYQVSLGRLFA